MTFCLSSRERSELPATLVLYSLSRVKWMVFSISDRRIIRSKVTHALTPLHMGRPRSSHFFSFYGITISLYDWNLYHIYSIIDESSFHQIVIRISTFLGCANLARSAARGCDETLGIGSTTHSFKAKVYKTWKITTSTIPQKQRAKTAHSTASRNTVPLVYHILPLRTWVTYQRKSTTTRWWWRRITPYWRIRIDPNRPLRFHPLL